MSIPAQKQSEKSFYHIISSQSPDLIKNLFCLGRQALAESDRQQALITALQFAGEHTQSSAIGLIFHMNGQLKNIYHNEEKGISRELVHLHKQVATELRPVVQSENGEIFTIDQYGGGIEQSAIRGILSIPILLEQRFLGTAFFSFQSRLNPYALALLQAFGKFIGDTAQKYIEEMERVKITPTEQQLRENYCFDSVIGHDPKLVEVMRIVSLVAPSDASILIQGETGTGKELIANAIHKNSGRRDKQFIPVNCGALPEHLLESELFGHVKGAFTNAFEEKIGWFERSNGGTIFLDEVSEMSPALQVRLLRILQTGEFSRVGSTEIHRCDVRVIAATNKNLKNMVQQGKFRDDLYYRLNVIDITLPPLRDRGSDVWTLTKYFLRQFKKRYGKSGLTISEEAKTMIQNYDFPGNCRELENIIQAAVILADNNLIQPAHLSKLQPETTRNQRKYIRGIHGSFRDSKQYVVEQFEQNFIRDKLRNSGGNISRAARSSGMDVKNFHTKMTKYGIDPTQFK